jgi:farnesyl diphosphate synthase
LLTDVVFFQENYGKADPENVAKVKALYHELNLQV